VANTNALKVVLTAERVAPPVAARDAAVALG
jgi:hypothetical protein